MKIKSNYGLAFLAFGLLCLLTAAILSINTGEKLSNTLYETGGQFGPIVTIKNNEIYYLEFSQPLSNREWSSIEVELVDSAGVYQFSLSEELWFETGHDSDGYWEEGKRDFDMSLTLPDPGTYFLNIKSSNSGPGIGGISVKASKELGSMVAFMWMGVLFSLLGALTMYMSSRSGK